MTRFLGLPEPPPREERVTLAYDTNAPNDLEAVEEQNEFGLPVFAAYEMKIQWDTGEDFISAFMYFADHSGVRAISLVHASPSFYDFMLNPGTTITTPPARLFDYVRLDEFEGEEVYMLWGNFPMTIDPDSVVYIPEPAGLPLILWPAGCLSFWRRVGVGRRWARVGTPQRTQRTKAHYAPYTAALPWQRSVANCCGGVGPRQTDARENPAARSRSLSD